MLSVDFFLFDPDSSQTGQAEQQQDVQLGNDRCGKHIGGTLKLHQDLIYRRDGSSQIGEPFIAKPIKVHNTYKDADGADKPDDFDKPRIIFRHTDSNFPQ